MQADIKKRLSIMEKAKADWRYMARVVFGCNLDPEQEKILHGIQHNRKVSVRSGNARGKDYVSAVAPVCFLATYTPALVVVTAPTGRQVTAIMMKEIRKIYNGSRIKLGGEVLSQEIKYPDGTDKYLIGFKAADKATEAWTGFHCANMMVIVTEASGLPDETFTSIDSILTGNSTLVIIHNPNRVTGEAARSSRNGKYKHYHLNCMNAPNVVAKKHIYPGQCDFDWVNDKVERWCRKISEEDFGNDEYDFRWEGGLYRPNNDYLVKVMGEYPREDPDTLIPYSWIVAANERYNDYMERKRLGTWPDKLFICPSCKFTSMQLKDVDKVKCENCGSDMKHTEYDVKIRDGVDVAGQGRDNTVYIKRTISPYINVAYDIETEAVSDHYQIVDKIGRRKEKNSIAYIDAIGEGSGTYAIACKENIDAVAVKFSYNANGFTDKSGQKTFANMRSYCYWAIRDDLDPKLGGNLMLPECSELAEDLTAIKVKKSRANGDIVLIDKDEIKSQIGRSTDWGDPLANTYFPLGQITITFG